MPRLVGMNEPCVQSWKTMNVRSRKPAVGIAIGSTTQNEVPLSSIQICSAISARYGTTEVSRSSMLRGTLAWAYGAMSAFQLVTALIGRAILVRFSVAFAGHSPRRDSSRDEKSAEQQDRGSDVQDRRGATAVRFGGLRGEL